jgi:uncharacterized membrane protein (DUF485 family)
MDVMEREMDEELLNKIWSSPNYRELVRKRSQLGWTLSGAVLVAYYAYILLIAFDKDLLAARIGGGVTTWGIPIGLFLIVFTVALTGLYVLHANVWYDELTERIKREAA